MFESDKVIRLEIRALKGELLSTITDNYSFPKKVESKEPQNVMIVKSKKLPVMTKGTLLDIIAYMKSGDRISYPAIVEMSIEEQLNLSLQFSRANVLEERRRYFKIETDENCSISLIIREGKRAELDPSIPGKILNINLGGIFLSLLSPLILKVDDTVSVEVPNMMGEKIAFNIKILRIQANSNGDISGYGCCFLYLDSKQEQILAKYINKLQIEKRKQGRMQNL